MSTIFPPRSPYTAWLLLFLMALCSCNRPSPVIPQQEADRTMIKKQASFRDAAAINAALGRGINYGSNFTTPYGTRWWDHDYSQEHFLMMARDGFRHVRIFFNWERLDRCSQTPPYTIHQDYIDSMKMVVQDALDAQLYVIIGGGGASVRHDPVAGKDQFLSCWAQVAAAFKAYPDRVLFEILNEPNKAEHIPADVWNTLAADALNVIRQTNPQRCVLLATPEFNHVKTPDLLNIPAGDRHLILTVHYYEPMWFTHQGAEWIGNNPEDIGYKWNDSEIERAIARDDFKRLLQISAEKNIPVHVGEFGVYKKADMASRIRWTRYMARMFESMNLSWCHWEFSDDFDIYNAVTNQVTNPDLLSALMTETTPAPGTLTATALFADDFSNGWGKWGYWPTDSARATGLLQGDKLALTIIQPGTENWDIGIYRWGVPLQAGTFYHLSFYAASADKRTIDCTIENIADSILRAESFRIDETDHQYHYIFRSGITDEWGKIKFRLGGRGPGTVSLHSIKMEKIQY